MSKFHCPTCMKFVSNVYAEEYGNLEGVGSWNPYYKWHVVGTCKIHGVLELKDHDGEEGCDCYCVDYRDAWWED